MPYKTFFNWLFDGNVNSEIPKPRTDDSGKVIVPDILKYNSPITHTYVVSIFLRHAPLTRYLDEYFNDINLRYLERADLFKFIKKCVCDFRIRKNDTVFYPRKERQKLFEVLRERVPYLKDGDLFLLCDMIEKSDEKEQVYSTLGLSVPKKEKLKIKKETKKTTTKISIKDYLEKHFSIVKI
jgi:hypothetical protein